VWTASGGGRPSRLAKTRDVKSSLTKKRKYYEKKLGRLTAKREQQTCGANRTSCQEPTEGEKRSLQTRRSLRAEVLQASKRAKKGKGAHSVSPSRERKKANLEGRESTKKRETYRRGRRLESNPSRTLRPNIVDEKTREARKTLTRWILSPSVPLGRVEERSQASLTVGGEKRS